MRMLNNERQEQKIKSSKPTIALVVDLALTGIGRQSRIVQDIAIRKCSEWLNSIFGSAKYGAIVKKQIQEQIGKMNNLTITQKRNCMGVDRSLVKGKIWPRKCYLDCIDFVRFLIAHIQLSSNMVPGGKSAVPKPKPEMR